MRYKQFLSENRSKRINPNKCISLLEQNCSKAINAYKKGNIIYRGLEDFNGNRECLYVNPKSYVRESHNTQNYYTWINDNSPKWNKYPKRSESIICTTERDIAVDYGNVYIVFPYDGAKIGVCSNSDYWYSFSHLRYETKIASLDSFNHQLNSIFENFGKSLDYISDYDDLKYAFKEFDNIIKESDEEWRKSDIEDAEYENIKYEEYKGSRTIDYLIDSENFELLQGYTKYEDLMKYLQSLLDPSKNKFSLKRIGDSLPKDREIWTDSKSILILEDKVSDYV